MAAPARMPVLLEKLQNSDNKVPVLEELKTLVTTTRQEQLRDVANDIFYDVLFECLITSRNEQVQLVCRVLEGLFECLDPALLLSKYEGDLLRGLEHPSAVVKMLSLHQILRLSKTLSQKVAASPDIIQHLVVLPADESLAVAELVTEIFVALGQNPESLRMTLQPDVLRRLKLTMETSDTVRFRVYEMIVMIASISPEALDCLTSHDELLQRLSDEAQNDDDILVQLNSIEMLKDLALCQHGLLYLDKQGVLTKLENMLVSIDSNPLAGLLLPGLLKFFGNICYLHPEELTGRFRSFLTLLFGNINSSDPSLCTIAIETIALLGSKPEGKVALHKQGAKMTDACKQIGLMLVNSPNESRVKCLQSANDLVALKVEDQSAELLEITEKWFKAFHTDILQVLLNIAKQPFLELRCSALRMITSIALVGWGQRLLNDCPGFNEYLLDRSTENTKEGKEAKYQIVKTLANSPTAADIFGNPYLVKVKVFEREGPFYLEAEAAIAFEEGS